MNPRPSGANRQCRWGPRNTEIVEQVRLLDGLVRYRFGDDAELMGVWSSARNVLGPFRFRSEPDAGDGEMPSEAGPEVVKLA